MLYPARLRYQVIDGSKQMTLCGCMVQAGQISDAEVHSLEQGLSAISNSHFGEPAQVSWTTIAAGNGWTCGEPSTSSIVVMYVPPGLEQPERTVLLQAICDLWTSTTGCSIAEIVATARDLPNQEN